MRGSRSGRGPAALAVFALGVVCPGSWSLAAAAPALTIRWEANRSDHDLNGYRVYVSTDHALFSLTPSAARPKAVARTVGPSTTETTIDLVDPRTTRYVAVTSLDTSGNESVFSEVVSWPPSAPVPGGAASIVRGQRDIRVGGTVPRPPERPRIESHIARRSPAP